MTKLSVGKNGENVAQAFLRSQDYEILHVNWRHGRLGELDIVAYYPPTYLLVFIEVKTRNSSMFGSPLEAVTLEKQNKIRSAAEQYLVTCPPTSEVRQVRFDVIAVTGPADTVTHYPNAF